MAENKKGVTGIMATITVIVLIVAGVNLWHNGRQHEEYGAASEAANSPATSPVDAATGPPPATVAAGPPLDDVMLILGAPVKEDLDMQPVVLDGVQANEVISDRVFVAGPSDEQQVAVMIQESLAESVEVVAGQTLKITGVIKTIDKANVAGVEPRLSAVEEKALTENGLYINASAVDVLAR